MNITCFLIIFYLNDLCQILTNQISLLEHLIISLFLILIIYIIELWNFLWHADFLGCEHDEKGGAIES